MIIIEVLISALSGYLFGRTGHILGGQLAGPHHWIYGLAIMILGLALIKKTPYAFQIIGLGLGLIVSDLKDLWQLKIYGIDQVEIKRFWHID